MDKINDIAAKAKEVMKTYEGQNIAAHATKLGWEFNEVSIYRRLLGLKHSLHRVIGGTYDVPKNGSISFRTTMKKYTIVEWTDKKIVVEMK